MEFSEKLKLVCFHVQGVALVGMSGLPVLTLNT
jgi:hypothetical protein